MLHVKFQNYWPSSFEEEFKGYAIIRHGGHLCHVTLFIYIIIHFPFLIMLHLKFCFDCQAVSEKKIFEYHGHIHVYSPGTETDNPLGPNIILKQKYFAYLHTPSKFLPVYSHFTNFAIHMHWRPKLTLP